MLHKKYAGSDVNSSFSNVLWLIFAAELIENSLFSF